MSLGSIDESYSALIRCNDEGVFVDFSKILNELELKIAIDIQKSHDLSLGAVERAYNYCDGDFDKFQQSRCFNFLLNNTRNEVTLEYDTKLKICCGLTGQQLRFSTPSTLIEQFKGDNTLIDSLTRMRTALVRQLKRKTEQQIQIFAREWVRHYLFFKFYM